MAWLRAASYVMLICIAGAGSLHARSCWSRAIVASALCMAALIAAPAPLQRSGESIHRISGASAVSGVLPGAMQTLVRLRRRSGVAGLREGSRLHSLMCAVACLYAAMCLSASCPPLRRQDSVVAALSASSRGLVSPHILALCPLQGMLWIVSVVRRRGADFCVVRACMICMHAAHVACAGAVRMESVRAVGVHVLGEGRSDWGGSGARP